MLIYGTWEPTNKLRWIRREDGGATLQQFCVSYKVGPDNFSSVQVTAWRDIEVVDIDNDTKGDK